MLFMTAGKTSDPPHLTSRQREVCMALCAGLLRKEIAGRLKISESGVRRHIEKLCKKFGVDCRLQLAVKFIESELSRGVAERPVAKRPSCQQRDKSV